MSQDSKDLNYDGTTIHNNYNGWIQNLEKGLHAVELALGVAINAGGPAQRRRGFYGWLSGKGDANRGSGTAAIGVGTGGGETDRRSR